MTGYLRALAAALPLLGCSVAHAGTSEPTGNTGILPAQGRLASSQQLNATIGRQVAERGLRGVLGPNEVTSRLAAAPGVAAAVARATSQIENAERAAVGMQRQRAIDGARAALATLQQVRARYHAPRLVARAYVVLAQAHLLDPSDPAAAQSAFGEAFKANPAYAPDEKRMAPRVLQLVSTARQQSVGDPVAPAATQRAALAQQARLAHVIWIGVSPIQANQLLVKVRLYDASGKQRASGNKRIASEQLTTGAASLVAQLLATTLPTARQPKKLRHATKPTPQKTKRWYRRWWVWAIIGGAAAGAAAGIVLLATSGEDEPATNTTKPPPTTRPGFDFHFDFQ